MKYEIFDWIMAKVVNSMTLEKARDYCDEENKIAGHVRFSYRPAK